MKALELFRETVSPMLLVELIASWRTPLNPLALPLAAQFARSLAGRVKGSPSGLSTGVRESLARETVGKCANRRGFPSHCAIVICEPGVRETLTDYKDELAPSETGSMLRLSGAETKGNLNREPGNHLGIAAQLSEGWGPALNPDAPRSERTYRTSS